MDDTSPAPSPAPSSATTVPDLPVSKWLPARRLPQPLTFTGTVLNSRHRGRFVFFAAMQTEAGEQAAELQLLFRSRASSGEMDDAELRGIKQNLRPGDTLRVTVHSIEDPAAADGQALLHVQSASLLSMSLRSNTGFERSRELDDGTDANGGVHALSEREAHELPADNDEEDDDSEHSKDGNGEDAQRQERAQLFAQWAAKHFPHLVHESPQLSRRGNPPFALDVAGGRGELSLHLTLQGIYATLVDPRPSSGYLSKWQRKILRRSGRPSFQVVHQFFGEAGGEASAELAQQASLVLGMHPDECTEAIVDAALAARVPFAVVPCCVFTRLFPHRRLANGQPVRTREQFCEYLRQKEPSAIRIGRLPFKGANAIGACACFRKERGLARHRKSHH